MWNKRHYETQIIVTNLFKLLFITMKITFNTGHKEEIKEIEQDLTKVRTKLSFIMNAGTMDEKEVVAVVIWEVTKEKKLEAYKEAIMNAKPMLRKMVDEKNESVKE